MKNTIYILFIFLVFSCEKKENKLESILNKMELRLSAENSTTVERDENIKGLGFRRVLNIDFINCKNIDLMDRSLKQEMRVMVIEIKNNIEGSENIDVYKVKLIKDPNDKTPTKSGLNIFEKGFTFNREELFN
ncbi:MAG: hypothetical protein AAFZ15_08040 [Bacteroidota bacterium]